MGIQDQVTYPFEERIPHAGEALEVAPGILWIRMPLPFALDHINLWLIDEGDGWTIVDTGYGVEATWALWERHLAATMGGRAVNRIVVTHYHPDHVGCAAWLVERTGAPLWMTAAEFLSAHAAHADVAGFDRENTVALYTANGVPATAVPESTRKVNGYRRGVPEVPRRYRRMMHGDRLSIGGHDWEVITVFGHAPEHAALWCASRNVLISGDQVLPRITTNVAVWGSQPESNPLRLFLESMSRFAHVAADALVLPSHDRVFRGVHARIAELHDHHQRRLERLLQGCERPITAYEALPLLFKRRLDDHQLMFAMGEAIAHLHYLQHAGRVRRMEQDGLRRFVKVESPA